MLEYWYIERGLLERQEHEQLRTSNQKHWRRGNFPFRKQAMPFSRHLENFLTLNKFFSTKLKKNEDM